MGSKGLAGQVLQYGLPAILRQGGKGDPPAKVAAWHGGAMLAKALGVEWVGAHAEAKEGSRLVFRGIQEDDRVAVKAPSAVVVAGDPMEFCLARNPRLPRPLLGACTGWELAGLG